MSKEAVDTRSAPAAIGPYSQSIRACNLIYTAGQIALDPATGQLTAGGIKEQTARVLENLTAILEAGGSSLDRVLKTTVYLKDLNDFLEMNSVYEMYLGKGGAASPARTTVGVTRLPKDALIEIDLVAEV